MIGGPDAAVAHLDPIFATLAPGARRRSRPPPADGRHRAARLPALRPERRRPLRQDGPQRHRIRRHGRLCRRHQHPEGGQCRQGASARPMPRPARCRTRNTISSTSTLPPVAEVWRHGSVIGSWLLDLTAGALKADSGACAIRRPRLGFGRRPLDAEGGDRHRRAGAGARLGAVRPVQLARRIRIRRQAAVGDALCLRRPCREAEGRHRDGRATEGKAR